MDKRTGRVNGRERAARVCKCGTCQSCKADARFEAIYNANHADEERAYYEADDRSRVGSSARGLERAAIFIHGRPRRSTGRNRKG